MTSRLQVLGQSAKFYYPISIRSGVPIGMFEIMFGQTSHFIYKTNDYSEVHDKQMYSSDIPRTDSFFIRRKAWVEMLEETDGVPKSLKKNILRMYMEKIYLPIQRYQNKQLDIYANKNNKAPKSPIGNKKQFFQKLFHNSPSPVR